jgi:hypothetical protein
VNNRPKLVVSYTPQSVVGACCNGSTCTLTAPAACLPPAIYQGNGTTCTPNPCVIVTGACCANSGTCTEGTPASCVASGGGYRGDGTTCATTECPVVLTPYLDPLPIPPDATPVFGVPGGTATYNLTMKESKVQLHSQLAPTRVWGYDDGFHGAASSVPCIEARTGQPVTVHWANDLRVFETGQLRTSHALAVDTACIEGRRTPRRPSSTSTGARARRGGRLSGADLRAG